MIVRNITPTKVTQNNKHYQGFLVNLRCLSTFPSYFALAICPISILTSHVVLYLPIFVPPFLMLRFQMPSLGSVCKHYDLSRTSLSLRILLPLCVGSRCVDDSCGFVALQWASDKLSGLVKAISGEWPIFQLSPQLLHLFIHFSFGSVCFLCSYFSLSAFHP